MDQISLSMLQIYLLEDLMVLLPLLMVLLLIQVLQVFSFLLIFSYWKGLLLKGLLPLLFLPNCITQFSWTGLILVPSKLSTLKLSVHHL